MFGLSVPELILVGIIALVVFGPDKLPEIASKMGRLAGELKRHSDSLRREFYNSVYRPIEEAELNARREQRNLFSDTTSGDAKPEPIGGVDAATSNAATNVASSTSHPENSEVAGSATCSSGPETAETTIQSANNSSTDK